MCSSNRLRGQETRWPASALTLTGPTGVHNVLRPGTCHFIDKCPGFYMKSLSYVVLLAEVCCTQAKSAGIIHNRSACYS